MRILVVNAGSSSLKLRLLDGTTLVVDHTIGADAGHFDEAALVDALAGLGSIDGVGHRVVHGGADLVEATPLTPGVLAAIAALTPLAPLHQPAALAAITATSRQLPGVPAFACFDTAFHATLPEEARTYAVPAVWRERHGVRRYGFHGLSHRWVAGRALELAPPARRLISCHLGSGASLCAIAAGRSVDTTMGMTPLEGLVMATRSGSVDPGALLVVQEREGLSAAEMYDALDRQSGMRALTGSADMREVQARAAAGDPAAVLARAVHVHRLAAGIAAMAAALGGVDVLAFTGGVGENDAPLRAATAERLPFLGVVVDPDRNASARPDADLSAAGAPVRTLVIEAREDLEVARQVGDVLTRG